MVGFQLKQFFVLHNPQQSFILILTNIFFNFCCFPISHQTLRARVAAKTEEKRLELLFLRWSEHHKRLSNFIRFVPFKFKHSRRKFSHDKSLSLSLHDLNNWTSIISDIMPCYVMLCRLFLILVQKCPYSHFIATKISFCSCAL